MVDTLRNSASKSMVIFHSCRADGENGSRHILGQAGSDRGHPVPHGFHCLFNLFDLIEGCICLGRFTGQALQFFLCRDDFPLEWFVLVLIKVTALHLSFRLFLSGFQRIRLFLDCGYGRLQIFLLQGEKPGIGWIRLQKTFHILYEQ